MVLVKSPVDHEELIRILKNHGCIPEANQVLEWVRR